MSPSAKHFCHIANEVPVSNSKLLQLNRFLFLCEIYKKLFFAHVSINSIKSELMIKGKISFK